MRRLLPASLLVLALAAGAASAQEFSSLEERMSHAEFVAAGLDKLTPEELAALNAWIGNRLGTGTVAPAGEDRRGFPAQSAGPGDMIMTTIEGEFRGWNRAGQRFTFANGQVWEVVDSSTRLAVRLDNPMVFIEPGVLGSWYMRIDGYNARAKVKRIR